MNVGKLKKLIADIPDDTIFFVCQGDDAWEGSVKIHCERGFYTPYFQISNKENHKSVPFYTNSISKNDTIKNQKKHIKIPLLKEFEEVSEETEHSTNCICTDFNRKSYTDANGIRRCDLCDKPLGIQF